MTRLAVLLLAVVLAAVLLRRALSGDDRVWLPPVVFDQDGVDWLAEWQIHPFDSGAWEAAQARQSRTIVRA